MFFIEIKNYYIQLDFVKLLLIYNYKNINYLLYYEELLANYRSYYYKHDDLFQNHLVFLKKCQDILSADARIKNDNNNILENVLFPEEDGTYGLYVNGAASNIA